MTIPIVDRFKVVHVDEQQRAAARGRLRFLAIFLPEILLVEHTRQRINRGLLQQLFLLLLHPLVRLGQVGQQQQLRGAAFLLLEGILREFEIARLPVDRIFHRMALIVCFKPVVRQIVGHQIPRVEVFVLQDLPAVVVDAHDAAGPVDDQDSFARVEKQVSIDIVRAEV